MTKLDSMAQAFGEPEEFHETLANGGASRDIDISANCLNRIAAGDDATRDDIQLTRPRATATDRQLYPHRSRLIKDLA
jgi:hypothetical protein